MAFGTRFLLLAVCCAATIESAVARDLAPNLEEPAFESEAAADPGDDSTAVDTFIDPDVQSYSAYDDYESSDLPAVGYLDGPSGASSGWVRAEYLGWGSEGMSVPPLATSSPTGTASTSAGVIGAAGTQIILGDSEIVGQLRSGGRFEAGAWLNADAVDGISFSYTFLDEASKRFSGNQTTQPILARPFFNVGTGDQDSRLINFAGLVQGSLQIQAASTLQSASFDYRGRAYESPFMRWDFLLVYRFASLSDNVTIRELTTSLSGATNGQTFSLVDSFDVKNRFHGCEFGFASTERITSLWSGDMVAKAAIGGVFSTGRVFGQTDVTDNGVLTTSEGGLLALGSNSGTHRDTDFGALWDLGFRLRRTISPSTALIVGYDWFLWTSVQRAGDQIDLQVNTSQIPPGSLSGEARPRYPASGSAYWAQGLSCGLEARY